MCPFHMEDVRCDNEEEAIYAAKETSLQNTLLSSFKQRTVGKLYIWNVLSLNSKLIACDLWGCGIFELNLQEGPKPEPLYKI